MGIELALQGFDGDRTFTSGEAVTGSVLLKLDQPTTVSDITICLHGSVKTSLVEKGSPFILGNDLPTVAEENHQLFKVSNVLFPPRDLPQLSKSYTLSKREYSFPFEICFPQARNHSDAQFPPSFSSRSEKHSAEANIEYVLTIELRRPGRFRRRIEVERQLDYLPSDAAPVWPASLGSGPHIRQAALCVHSLVSTPAGAEIPVLILEGILPSPPVLYAGRNLPVQLRIRSLPTQQNYTIPIELQHIAIFLRSTTAIVTGSHPISWNSSRALVKLKGLGEHIVSCRDVDSITEINSSILENTIVPKVPPSFNSNAVEQKYSLEVEAEFSLGNTKLNMVKIAIEVDVRSGCCSENGAISHHTTEGPGYLDLFGAFGSGVDRQPPPCYSPAIMGFWNKSIC
ncbi:hypothetical protein BDW75DRAFT_243046 [Aspergillus navahoensis]